MTSPTNEQQRVDVLAVMDLAASWLPYDGEDDNVSAAFDEARAAVAELIEAAKDVDAGSGGCPCPTCERLRKALANVGGTK